ncbi:VOC family protein [Nitrosomonas sp. JL21]|uniref:VOC family protein n=1 Tax=Nitrosomonas sp. JL21 TaxID=153949 RepID=UPI00136D71D2|nr:VOC family protein [Nitrosomonas sp. JL21]MBL8497063.1 VOC family protein [Nitrosomonas sp.]MXS78435.1 VOC family protein [Nitrosomonas sp. JL21]
MKANAVGINHVALEVGDIEEAIKFYSDFLNFEVHEKNELQAIIYFGDQFINFIKNDNRQADQKRHFGIAVDNKELVRQTLEHMGVKLLSGSFLDFLDPWGNRIEITTYSKIQYTKADHVLRGMGLGHLQKTEEALAELNAKGLGPT